MEGNRLTNDGRTAMKGEEDWETFTWKRGLFIDARVFLIPKTTMMMKLKTAKNHSDVPCSSSSYRLEIIEMTLFAVGRFQQFINVFPWNCLNMGLNCNF